MNKCIKIFSLFINLCLYGTAKITPKKNDLWVFGAWFGKKYSDNPKAFFQYINTHQTNIQAIWISKELSVVQEVRKQGYRAYHATSLIGLWCQMRAQKAFVCQALPDDLHSPSISSQTEVINLWHGLPLKKIMYDVFGDRVIKKNAFGKLVDTLSPYNTNRTDYLIATSEETQKTLAQAFRLPKEKVLITGFPRNDIFLLDKTHQQGEKFKCLYMPTFRGSVGSEFDLFEQYNFDVKSIDQQLAKYNIELVLRMHPVNKPSQYIIEQIDGSQYISIDSTPDIFDSISSYDCLITDYSGGYFDYILTGKPILFAPFDLESYKQKERDLYYPYEDVTLAPYAYNWPELINLIIEVKQKRLPSSYQANYQTLQALFHDDIEANSALFSARLYQQINSDYSK